MKKVLATGILLLLPLFALSVYPNPVQAAGFAKQTLFLSKDSVTEGETVLIHAIVSNDTEVAFTGTLQVLDQDKVIGTVPVSLDAEEAAAVSVSWKPAAGSHILNAQLQNSAGDVVGKESETFIIDAAPKVNALTLSTTTTPTTSPDAVESSENIQKAIEGVSPAVARSSEPVFSTIDSLRISAAQALDNGVVWSKKQIGTSNTSGNILGVATEKNNNFGNTLWVIFATLALYALSIMRYLVSSAGIFYPLFALLFLFLLWKGFKRFRRR